MKKICIIGANGFLGLKCVQRFHEQFSVLAADISNSCIPTGTSFQKMDLTQSESVHEVLGAFGPDIILLTAAMTNVDGCEDMPEKACAINRDGPKAVAEYCQEAGARLIFISTDFVFDGATEDPYMETAAPHPLGVYGKSKLEAEQAIHATGIDALVCRTSVLYGWHHPAQRDNYVTWLVKQLQAGKPVKIVTSQFNTPTYCPNLAESLARMTEFSGFHVLHTVGSTCLNRYEFALRVADIFEFDQNLISPVDSFPQKAQRPPFGCLNNTKVHEMFDVRFWSVDEALREMKAERSRKE